MEIRGGDGWAGGKTVGKNETETRDRETGRQKYPIDRQTGIYKQTDKNRQD